MLLGRPTSSPYWIRVKKSDPVGVSLANRHYSRRTFGTQGTMLGPPGRLLCLLSCDEKAVWVSHWPYAEYAMDGMDAYRCSMFRNEGNNLSSMLILEAERVTEEYWGPPPVDGWLTYVAPDLVRSRNPGYTFKKAGWTLDRKWRTSRRDVRLLRLRKVVDAAPISDSIDAKVSAPIEKEIRMAVEIEDMPSDVVLASRQLTSPLHEKLEAIRANKEYHGELKVLDRFDLPLQKGKAYQQKQNMQSRYGSSPSILGFSFVVTTSTDGSCQYLGVTFDPSKIVDGAYDEWETEKEQKAEAAAERKLKREARAEIEDLEGDD